MWDKYVSHNKSESARDIFSIHWGMLTQMCQWNMSYLIQVIACRLFVKIQLPIRILTGHELYTLLEQ